MALWWMQGQQVQHLPIKVALSEDENFLGKWSKLIKTQIKIDPQGAKIVKIRARYVAGKSFRFEHMVKSSRVGFWAGVNDAPEKYPAEPTKWFTSSRLNEDDSDSLELIQPGYEVDILEWKFGSNASMRFRKQKQDADMLEAVLVARPFFIEPVREITLKLTMIVENENGREETYTKNIIYSVDEHEGRGEDDRIELLSEFGALSFRGDGVSVHPKQLHSAYVIIEAIKKVQRNIRSDLNIGYIGPDTTENLRTCIRQIYKNADIDNKKITIHVACTRKWDISSAFLPFEDAYKLENSPIDIKFYDVDLVSGKTPVDDRFLPIDECPDLDVLLATYVTSWAITSSEKSRKSYTETINRLVHPDKTLFYTVEPKSSTNCVIEIPNPNYTDNERSTNQFYIHALGFEKPIPVAWNKQSFVKALNWRLKKGKNTEELS